MKIICVGLNYPRHAEEINMRRPEEPVVFMKPDTALLKDNNPFYIPDWAGQFDYELEVVARICRLGRHIEKQFAHRYYDALGLGIDFTARDLQRSLVENGRPWEVCKSFDYSAAVSKFVAKEELPLNVGFHLDVNGERRQEGNTGDMLFSIDEIISYVSRYFSLRIGDLIFTGTPVGVGPVRQGDRLTAYMEGTQMMDFLIK